MVALMAKSVDARDLKSLGKSRAGSIPAERTRHYLDGEPYYCAICKLGYGEYMACELPNCRLESKATSMKRRNQRK
jgi:hypothetical protein